MDEVRQKIYEAIKEHKITPENAVVAWSGGPYSTLVWFVVLQELGIKLPVIFVDDSAQPVGVYSFVERIRRKYDLNFEIRQCETGKVFEELKKEKRIVLTGKPLDFGLCILPQTRETWNFLKSISMPFFKVAKRTLG